MGDKPKEDASFVKKLKMTLVAFIKCVYEVDPLKCPKCGGTMKIISFIERHHSDVVERLYKLQSLEIRNTKTTTSRKNGTKVPISRNLTTVSFRSSLLERKMFLKEV